MPSIIAYKVAVLIFLVTAIGASGTTYYFYHQQNTKISQNSDLNNQIESLNSQIDSYKTQTNKLNAQISTLNTEITSLNQQTSQFQTTIAQLQSQVSQLQTTNSQQTTEIQQLQAQLSQLQSQVSQLQSQVSQLQSQVTSLQSQLAQLQNANLIGIFTASNNCPFFSNCSYNVNGAYANTGSKTAFSASVVFTFYSGAQATGQILCTTTYVLGDISGRSISTIPQVACGGTTSTSSQSFTWTFNYG